ncbi:cytoskeletal protein CcmA (bactofilin family) [Dongia mobilis]|uniref:Cytoskeletal protein CcmA (Bactofilin family) n=1 Tax=Dongia mobilis TaxID=578943 RepID=A0A4R6WNK9_9PROT|nr:polymer-forming cytoskeletal protein [Dongia mobilis]TDQ82523.1 cytoskeletal protein CcmA (bactofilin family) [Dongia mobilis]
MFSKVNKSGPNGAATDSTRPGGKSGVPSIISADLRITGDLVCSGDVQIDGWVEGDVQSRNITIGEGATVQGGLQAESVRICGLVNGEVRADIVVLEKTAKVTGDILHKSLAIEQGAFIEGMCRRIDGGVKPAATAPAVTPAANATPAPEAEKKAAANA